MLQRDREAAVVSVQAVAEAASILGCVTFEVRVQSPTGVWRRDPKRVRVVTQCPDAASKEVLARIVKKAEGTVEENPERMGMGVPLPLGFVLTFSFPFDGETLAMFSALNSGHDDI